jgi:hypothetical protein
MNLLFHIGAEKTGSTAVQEWLHRNSGALRESGIWYSETLGRPNNTGIYLYAGGVRSDEGFLFRGAVTDEQKLDFIKKTRLHLIQEVAEAKNAGCHTFVISNEHCHSRLISPRVIQHAADLLQPLFDQIKIYFVIRPQLDMCLSLASTQARVGGEVSSDWFLNQMRPDNHYFDYYGVLQKWSSIYGRDCLVPVPYRRNKDVIAYFASELGADPAKLTPVPRVNEALDYRTMAVANALQLKLHRPNGAINKNATFFIETIPVVEKLRLDRSFAMQLQAGYSNSNDALFAEWPQIEPADLEVDWSSYDEKGNLHKLHALDEYSPVLTFIVERFNALNWLERAKLKNAESKNCELKNAFPQAIKLVDDAIEYARTAMEIQSVRAQAEQLVTTLQARKQFLKSKLNSADS